MGRLLGALTLAALGLTACASFAPKPEAPPQVPAPQQVGPAQPESSYVEEGVASWYGLAFHGRRTASGERFDMNAFTAAHPSLPFGTRVRVRNPHNGRTVTVRINDRGPHVAGRIIDLSHAAARALGLLGFGTKAVVITLAEPSAETGRSVE
jgi:rare lipoprotein A